jgi:serine/threonine-protein kinase HipA
VEDFGQLAGLSRNTKYDYSMEKIVGIVDRFCTFPALEKAETSEIDARQLPDR